MIARKVWMKSRPSAGENDDDSLAAALDARDIGGLIGSRLVLELDLDPAASRQRERLALPSPADRLLRAFPDQRLRLRRMQVEARRRSRALP